MDSEFRPNPETNPEDITPSNNPQESFPKKYPVQHILKGSRKAIINTMHTLHVVGYAEIVEWTPLQPTGLPGEFITMMTKYLTLG
ncbi:MAG: hypothetical protein F6J94_22555 [Moorea sp. SIO1F2]|uniref:hypothetical protein n=1 Tax=unclassified Moorena TaxID=2683338 RepID=UPI0013B727E9|nr:MULTISPECIES: hypothetical protein [unclassified Moorena]NEO07526.1 hypothetical protein [Moorena sp. SIO3I8]NEO11026.1 hypothetical protein [Moorena sp. SIO3E8]NEO22504.1 hypothetical protein [Moorena sp. SIO4A5]NEP99140.1 hypothetical protein [Moorena sp. SIO3F7]NEQ60812.1 hypothetical protein [Moorena sp. SIO4A1]